MAILSYLKEEFFDKIYGKHLLIFISNGIDSVCTFKILKYIFKNHNILFSYSLIKNKSDLKASFVKYGIIENVLLINCGALFDVIEFLEIGESENRTIYILDSQRPIHVNNFYNSTQVKILTLRENFDNIPEFNDIFTNDESDEEIDSDSESNHSEKRIRYDKEYLEERIKKREWKKHRDDLMFEYENCTFHGTSSSIIAYHLTTLIRQDCWEILWSAIVGHSSQFIFNLISREAYITPFDLLESYLSKLFSTKKDSNFNNFRELNIERTEELLLWLYQHWSLKEAINYTPLTMSTFRLCKISGTKLKEFLAYIGLPRLEYENIFSAMKLELKQDVVSLFKDNCKRFNLPEEDLFLPSFSAHCGFHTKLSAIDATFVIAAILDDVKVPDLEDKFLTATRFLTMCNNKEITNGLLLAKDYIEQLNKFTKSIIESKDVITFGSFLQVTIKKNANPILQAPLMQYLMARYILEATFSVSPRLGKNRKTENLPLVICSELIDRDDLISMYGIPPLKTDKGKNLFGQIFDTVRITTNCQTLQDSFDICKFEIRAFEKLRIFQRISALLSE